MSLLMDQQIAQHYMNSGFPEQKLEAPNPIDNFIKIAKWIGRVTAKTTRKTTHFLKAVLKRLNSGADAHNRMSAILDDRYKYHVYHLRMLL